MAEELGNGSAPSDSSKQRPSNWSRLFNGAARSSDSSGSSWEGLPPLTPQQPAGQQPSAEACTDGGQQSVSVGVAENGRHLYPHLDPEVVEEMERLQMVAPQQRT